MQSHISTDTYGNRQSNDIYNYILDNSLYKYNCEEHYNCKIIPTTKNFIDKESTLLGLGQHLNKLPPPPKLEEGKPPVAKKQNNKYNDVFLFQQTNQQTRLPKSCEPINQIMLERFDFSNHDPQQSVINEPFRYNAIDSRNIFKDNNKSVKM